MRRVLTNSATVALVDDGELRVVVCVPRPLSHVFNNRHRLTILGDVDILNVFGVHFNQRCWQKYKFRHVNQCFRCLGLILYTYCVMLYQKAVF